MTVEWKVVADELPPIHTLVWLRDDTRWMNVPDDMGGVNWHGAGYLCEHGHKYWSVIGEMRAMTLESVTHWTAIDRAKGRGHG